MNSFVPKKMKHGKNFKVIRCACAKDATLRTDVVFPPSSDDDPSLLGRRIDNFTRMDAMLENEMFEKLSDEDSERERVASGAGTNEPDIDKSPSNGDNGNS